MNRTTLLSTAALALLLGSGAALAQAPSKDEAPAQPAPAAQQNAPAEKVAPPSESVERKANEIKSNEIKAETGKPAAAERSTTGQGAGAAARLSSEQRGKISTAIRQQKVQPVTLDVSVSVGTRLPSSVRYHPLPFDVVTVYPEWRGYHYILVGDQIVIVNPRTQRIVAIIEA